MQHKEEGQQNCLKHYELFEDYFSLNSTNRKIMAPISSIEDYIQTILTDDDMQLSCLNKYKASLYSESKFSSPEPFSPKSDLSSQSDTSLPPTTENNELVNDMVIPMIQIPEPVSVNKTLENESTGSKLSAHTFFDWPMSENVTPVRPLSFIHSNIDIMSMCLGIPHKNKRINQIIILAGIDFMPNLTINKKKHSPEEINQRKL